MRIHCRSMSNLLVEVVQTSSSSRVYGFTETLPSVGFARNPRQIVPVPWNSLHQGPFQYTCPNIQGVPGQIIDIDDTNPCPKS